MSFRSGYALLGPAWFPSTGMDFSGKAIEQAISLLQNRIDEYVLEKECVNDRIAGLQNAIAVLNNGAQEEEFAYPHKDLTTSIVIAASETVTDTT